MKNIFGGCSNFVKNIFFVTPNKRLIGFTYNNSEMLEVYIWLHNLFAYIVQGTESSGRKAKDANPISE